MLYTAWGVSDLSVLLQAIDASIRSVDYSINKAKQVYPPSHRVDMIRSQLETAREVLEKAKSFGTASSGLYQAVGPTEPPKKT